MMRLRQKLKRLLDSIDGLTLRERLFVFAALLIVIGGAWEAFLAAPLAAREAAASTQVESLQERLEQLNESLTIAAEGIGGGMSEGAARLQQLRSRVEQGADSVRIFTSDLVDPAQMRFVLEDLIRRQTGLELVRARNMEVLPLIEQAAGADGLPASDSPMLYRHGLVLELEGSYLECLQYLEAVERLPWQLFWALLNMETLDHPRIRIEIELYTLSLDEEWIGV